MLFDKMNLFIFRNLSYELVISIPSITDGEELIIYTSPLLNKSTDLLLLMAKKMDLIEALVCVPLSYPPQFDM